MGDSNELPSLLSRRPLAQSEVPANYLTVANKLALGCDLVAGAMIAHYQDEELTLHSPSRIPCMYAPVPVGIFCRPLKVREICILAHDSCFFHLRITVSAWTSAKTHDDIFQYSIRWCCKTR